MGAFQKIKNFFKSYNKETFHSRTEHFADGYFSKNSIKTLSVDEMLSLSYITKSIQMIANDVAKVKLVQKKTDPKTLTYTLNSNSRLYWMLNRKPNKNLNGFTFKTLLVWNLFLYQKAVIYCNYEKINNRYFLTELIPLYPEYVTKKFDDNSNIYYLINVGEEQLKVGVENIIYMEYAVINNVSNTSLRSLFKSTFEKLKENENSIINSIKNDTGVSMLINVPDITDSKAVENVQNSIDNMVRNQKRNGSIAMVKDRRWTIEPNTNIIESKIDYTTRNAIAREVAAVFGVPASKLGIEDNNKYNTLIERNRAYTDNAVKPILDIITNALTDYFFPTDMTSEITYRAVDLLSLDPGALKDFATSAINNAFATPNEIREMIGWDPVEEGCTLMANSAIQPVKSLISKAELEIENLKKPHQAKNESRIEDEDEDEDESKTETENENKNKKQKRIKKHFL